MGEPSTGDPDLSRVRSGGRRRRGLGAVLVIAATLSVAAGVPAVYVFGPLLGLFILRLGFATFDSLQAGAAHIPDGDPVPVDPTEERITYWCGGCGAEVLLLVRGTATPPRHCGERMQERRLVSRAGPPSLN